MSRAMAGGGDYDRHSEYQMHGGLSHLELITAAAAKLVPGTGPVVIAD